MLSTEFIHTHPTSDVSGWAFITGVTTIVILQAIFSVEIFEVAQKAPKATECASEEVKPGESELLELKRKNKATMIVTIFAKYKADKVALNRRKAGGIGL